MAFAFRRPNKKRPIITRILELDDVQKNTLLEKFKSFKTTSLTYDAYEDIPPVEGFDDFQSIFIELLFIFKLFQNLQEDQLVKDLDDFIQKFVNSFVEEYKLEKEPTIEDFDLKVLKLQEFLGLILASNENLYYIERARKLLIERGRLVGNTRIITDIRPIFKEEKIDEPEYCLIIHNLRIEYTKDFKNTQRSFYALDHEDLIHLQEQIKRALDKEQEMSKICKKAGLNNLGEISWNQ